MNRALLPCVLAMAGAFVAGCRTAEPRETLSYDAAHPLIRFSNRGILFQERFVTPDEAVALLEEYEIPKDKTLHILIDGDYTDRRAPWVFQHNYLGRAGYRRTILVHARKAESAVGETKQKPRGAKPDRGFRYKRADED